MQKGKDLTKEAPRSPRLRMGGFAIIARTIDKCRAVLWGNVGEYHFNCPLDNMLFGFKGVTGDAFKAFVETGASDEEIVAWVQSNGLPKTEAEIKAWSDMAEATDYSDNADKQAWLTGELAKLNMTSGTLFDYLEADDLASYKK